MIMSRISKEERLLFLVEMPARKERYTVMVTQEPDVQEETEEVEETEEETEEEETKEEEAE